MSLLSSQVRKEKELESQPSFSHGCFREAKFPILGKEWITFSTEKEREKQVNMLLQFFTLGVAK